MIVGIGHYARTGKDSLAEILVRDHGFTRVAFADALKALVYDTDACVAMLVDLYGWETAKERFPAMVRQPLIDVGNAARHRIGEDVWIKALSRDPEFVGSEHVVIPDMRYPNEARWVNAMRDGVTIKVTRPGVCPLDNVADQALVDFADWDYEIANDGSLDDLADLVADLVRNIRRARGHA